MREISNYYYRISGIYQKACNAIANMYRYDWYVVTEVYDKELKEDKIVSDFVKTLNYLDNSYIKKICGEIALQVVKNGVYYGYLVEGKDGILVQELPVKYCRSRYFVGNLPMVEFDMKFFDDAFTDIAVRLKTLKLFPQEFQKGYVLYKQNKLTEDNGKTTTSWFPLEPGSVAKFSLPNGEMPMFINAIPAIIDLDAAQDLDRRKQM